MNIKEYQAEIDFVESLLKRKEGHPTLLRWLKCLKRWQNREELVVKEIKAKDRSEAFEKFWKIHPAPVSKIKSREVWDDKVDDPDWVLASTLLYKKSLKPDDKIMHSYRWLDLERWEDYDKDQTKRFVGCQVCGKPAHWDGTVNGKRARLCFCAIGPNEYSECYKKLIGEE